MTKSNRLLIQAWAIASLFKRLSLPHLPPAPPLYKPLEAGGEGGSQILFSWINLAYVVQKPTHALLLATKNTGFGKIQEFPYLGQDTSLHRSLQCSPKNNYSSLSVLKIALLVTAQKKIWAAVATADWGLSLWPFSLKRLTLCFLCCCCASSWQFFMSASWRVGFLCFFTTLSFAHETGISINASVTIEAVALCPFFFCCHGTSNSGITWCGVLRDTEFHLFLKRSAPPKSKQIFAGLLEPLLKLTYA